MTDHLLNKCIEKYKAMLEACRRSGDVAELPDSFAIYHVKGVRRGGKYAAKKRLQAWRYTQGELFKIPSDADPVVRPQDKLFYVESYAEFGFSWFSKKAFINIYFGNEFAMGFVYDIYSKGSEFIIGNEKTAWTK